MIVEEILKQRLHGIKNKDGKYITPSFPKLIYVLDEHNCLRGGRFDYLTKLAAKCTIKRSYPDYVSAKVMREQFDGEVFSPMGCVDGDEIITYTLADEVYCESFESAWGRLSKLFTAECSPERYNSYYIRTKGIKIWDNVANSFVDCFGFIRNVQDIWYRFTLSNGTVLTVTDDHPFETVNRGIVLAKDLQEKDEISFDKEYNWSEYLTDVAPISTDHALRSFGFTLGEVIKTCKSQTGDLLIKVGDKVDLPNWVWKLPKADKVKVVKSFLDNVHNLKVMQESGVVTQAFLNKLQMFFHSCGYGITSYKGHYESWINIRDERVTTRVLKREAFTQKQYSYDVTTESEHFTVSGIYSHNCRSFLSRWEKTEWYCKMMNEPFEEVGKPLWEGRFNQGVVSLNLVQIGIIADGNMDKFWQLLDERLAKCYKALLLRHQLLEGTLTDTSPLHWQFGGIARLPQGTNIDILLHDGFSTLSLGYIGIYETVQAMLGVSHTTPEGKSFALKIMNYLNEACESWKKATGLGFGLYGTPRQTWAA